MPGAALVLAISIAQALAPVVNYYSQRIQLVFHLQMEQRVHTHMHILYTYANTHATIPTLRTAL